MLGAPVWGPLTPFIIPARTWRVNGSLRSWGAPSCGAVQEVSDLGDGPPGWGKDAAKAVSADGDTDGPVKIKAVAGAEVGTVAPAGGVVVVEESDDGLPTGITGMRWLRQPQAAVEASYEQQRKN